MAIWRQAAIAIVLACALAACDRAQKAENKPQQPPNLLSGEQAKPVMGEHASTRDLPIQSESPAAADAPPAPPVDFDTLSARAGQGDAAAEYELGIRYAEGNGVAKNPLMAVELFQAAADKGNSKAQFEMGSATLTGEGARPDIGKALEWYRMAAPNMVEAKTAADYLAAVRDGTDGATDQLHQAMWLYDDTSDDKALEKFQPLADAGNLIAIYYVGKITNNRYEDGDTDDRAMQDKAIAWYRKAADAGFVWAQLDLAQIHQERSWGTGADDPAELAEALRWYKAAQQQGSKAGLEGVLMLTAGDLPMPQVPDIPRQQAEPPAAPMPPAPPNAAPDGRSELQICGRMWGQWQWYTGPIPGVLTFDMQNRVGAAATAGAAQVLVGTWTCEAATSKFTITWQNGIVETYTMASDGSSISGRNNFGAPVRGTPLR